MNKKILKLITFFISIILSFIMIGCSKSKENSIPNYSKENIYVQDNAKLLNSNEINTLQNKCESLYKQKSIQMVFLTVKEIPDDYDLESFSNEVYNKWGIGDKKTDKGLLFVYAVKEDKIRFEVGYGLEGDIPDIKAKQIIINIRPNINNKKYIEAFTDAENMVTNIDNLNVTNTDKSTITDNNKSKDKGSVLVVFVVIIIVLILLFIITFIINLLRFGFNVRMASRSTNDFMFCLIDILIDILSSSSNHSSGSGSGGSFGGDSFGGGSSGGGGASG